MYDERLTWEGRADKMVIFVMTMTILAIIIMMTWKTWMNIIQIVMVLMRTFVQMTETMLIHIYRYLTGSRGEALPDEVFLSFASNFHQNKASDVIYDISSMIYDI